jgi:hypothetical protein
MMSCASMVAFIPEPQTLLMVVAPVASGSFAPRAAWRRRLALSGRQHAAHEHFVDPLRRQVCPFHRGADHMGTELVRAEGREVAHELAERRAGGGNDDDQIGSCGHGGRSSWSYMTIII